MLGVAWPQIRDQFGRSNGELAVLAATYGIGRLATSGFGGAALRRASYARATVAAGGAVAVAVGLFALAPFWWAVVAAAATVGLASGLLDALGARFLAVHGQVTSAGLVTGSYGVGATLGPALVAVTGVWRWSFGAAALTALTVAVVVSRSSVVWPGGLDAPQSRRPKRSHEPKGSMAPLVLSLALFFTFVGVEVTAGQWLATYLEDGRHVGGRTAGLAVSAFWAGVTIGRLVLARLRLGRAALVVAASGCALLLSSVSIAPTVVLAGVTLLAGMALSPTIPTLFAHTAERVGPDRAPMVSGWQLIAANLGGISLPVLTGILIGTVGDGAPIVVLVLVVLAGIALLLASYRQHPREAA